MHSAQKLQRRAAKLNQSNKSIKLRKQMNYVEILPLNKIIYSKLKKGTNLIKENSSPSQV